MAAALVDAIGLAGIALTTIGFAQSKWATSQPEGANVTIKGTKTLQTSRIGLHITNTYSGFVAGLPELDAEDDSLEGGINHVYAFDERNGYAGQSGGCSVSSGGICTKTMDQSVAGRRAGYIGVSNDNDYDDTRGGAWTGDIGYKCGQAWYNSVEPAGLLKDEDGGGDYIPNCTWIDGDHPETITTGALKFDVAAYGENVEDTIDNDACKFTIYGADNGPIADKSEKRKRSDEERPTWMMNQLIWSNHTSQPAAELCNSASSWGPDFIGPDGQFCDVETKTFTALCSSHDIDGFIEVDEDESNLTKPMSIARRSTNVVHKSYKKVFEWGH